MYTANLGFRLLVNVLLVSNSRIGDESPLFQIMIDYDFKKLAFFVMGDGGVYNINNRTFFAMNMLSQNIDYINLVKFSIEKYTHSKLYYRKDYNTDGCTRKEQLRLESASHEVFESLRFRIYTEKYKGLDYECIDDIDWEMLAILYMSDGSLVEDKPNAKKGLVNSSWNLTLNMKRLSFLDQSKLVGAIYKNLGVEFRINKQHQYFYMRLKSKDVRKFCENVSPYITDSFRYKVRILE